jgi:two-component system chemotaxis response regulator CheY
VQQALVVDDSRAIRMILARILKELGYAVAEAANGREALARIGELENQVQLALVDWNMPEMNGYELIQAVRARKELDSMRLVMVTTESEMEQIAKALEAGADEYVMKPFTKEVLVEKLHLVGARW